MPRYVLTVAYHGKDYAGFQSQPKLKTIQTEIEKSLKQLLGENIRVHPSGRTDSGVHALSQKIHIDVTTEKAIQRIQKKEFLLQINAVLPKDITIHETKSIHDQFHARINSKKKSYMYYLLISPIKNPFVNDFVWRLMRDPDEAAMKQAASYLVGKHDFSAFCASDSTVRDKVRTLHAIDFSHRCPAPPLKLKKEKYLCLEFTGNGFLKQMVRNLVGTLVAVGQGKLQPSDIPKILKSKDRRKAHKTAPAKGLFLKKVWY